MAQLPCLTEWQAGPELRPLSASLFQGLGGFSGFLVSMLVAFLVSTRKIHTTMSGYQVLRSALQFLGKVVRLGKVKGFTLPVNLLIISGIIQFLAMRQMSRLNSRSRQLQPLDWRESVIRAGSPRRRTPSDIPLAHFSHHRFNSQRDQLMSQLRSLLGEWGRAGSGQGGLKVSPQS